MPEPPVTIRDAEPRDAAEIARIHNEGIEDRVATFQTREQTAADGERRLARSSPVLVAERDGEVLGWAGAGPYEEGLDYYAGVAEVTVYVARAARGNGVGRLLLEAAVAESGRDGRHKLLGKIFSSNEASLALFESVGFRRVGVHERHSRLDGEWRDVVLVEMLLA